MANASALGSKDDERKKLQARRQPLLDKFGDDGTVATCYLLTLQLLREHDCPRRERHWCLPAFGAYRTSMVALVNAYWTCSILSALVVGLCGACGILTGWTLVSAALAIPLASYLSYRQCVVNADKDCRPKIELHHRKSKSVWSVLDDHIRAKLIGDDDAIVGVLNTITEIIGGDVVAEATLD